MSDYLFTSDRLGFRNWIDEDIEPLAELCADPEVMEFFPSTLTQERTTLLHGRLKDLYHETGTTFFAVDLLETGELIGFIGMLFWKECDFAKPPCMEIGWRLKREAWNKGYATEGARRCLQYCKEDLNWRTVISITSVVNEKSERIMQKIGMHKTGEFNHPKIEKGHWLERHVMYEINLTH